MPEVIVRYQVGFLREADIDSLRTLIPEIVAQHLSVPGTDAELTPSDIEVIFQEAGKFDVTQEYVFRMTISSNYSPEREAICKKAKSAIADRLSEEDFFLRKTILEKAFVWIRLSPGWFIEF